jgi:hypothetical protein
MGIDKPWRDDQTVGINDAFGVLPHAFSDQNDPIPANAYIHLFRRGARAIENGAITNQEIEALRLRRARHVKNE